MLHNTSKRRKSSKTSQLKNREDTKKHNPKVRKVLTLAILSIIITKSNQFRGVLPLLKETREVNREPALFKNLTFDDPCKG